MSDVVCHYCEIVLSKEYLDYTTSLYEMAGIYEPIACAKCYREKVNPIITKELLEEEFKSILEDQK